MTAEINYVTGPGLEPTALDSQSDSLSTALGGPEREREREREKERTDCSCPIILLTDLTLTLVTHGYFCNQQFSHSSICLTNHDHFQFSNEL